MSCPSHSPFLFQTPGDTWCQNLTPQSNRRRRGKTPWIKWFSKLSIIFCKGAGIFLHYWQWCSENSELLRLESQPCSIIDQLLEFVQIPYSLWIYFLVHKIVLMISTGQGFLKIKRNIKCKCLKKCLAHNRCFIIVRFFLLALFYHLLRVQVLFSNCFKIVRKQRRRRTKRIILVGSDIIFKNTKETTGYYRL